MTLRHYVKRLLRHFVSSGMPLSVLLLSLAPLFTLQAQVLYGSLTGNITDSTGAAVAGAKVLALNVGLDVLKIPGTNGPDFLQSGISGSPRACPSSSVCKTV